MTKEWLAFLWYLDRLALGRGLRLHLEDRVIVHGAKTIVFH